MAYQVFGPLSTIYTVLAPTLHLLFLDQARQIHDVPINAFAMDAITLESSDRWSGGVVVSLGRAGLERTGLSWDAVEAELSDSGVTVASLMEPLEGNYWVVSWMKKDIPEQVVKREYPEEIVRMNVLLKGLEERNTRLCNQTRDAARALLQAGRLLLYARQASPDPPSYTFASTLLRSIASPSNSSYPYIAPELTLFPSPVVSLPFASRSSPSSPSASSPAPLTSSSLSIPSLPYELIDIILQSLSPGCLSSNQHRLVMNWAEDRSTLGARKVDSETKFLRETNCWRWESDVERVNLGFGFE